MTLPTSPPLEPYEVYAIKYAEADALPLGKVEIDADPHQSTLEHGLLYLAYSAGQTGVRGGYRLQPGVRS